MTDEQAREVLAIALAGTATREMDDDKVRFLALHLAPLPYERTLDHVHRYVANHKWVSSLEELLDACGLPIDDARSGARARADLIRASREGGRLVRDLRSVSGWSYVPPGAALPPGAVEAEALAQQATTAALPAGQPMSAEEQQANLTRLAALARTLGRRRATPPPAPAPRVDPALIEAELAAFEERRTKGEKTR